MAPALPARLVAVADEPQVRLVDQGGRLQRLPARFVGQARSRQAAQLVVDQRQQFVGRPGVALAGGFEQPCDFAHGPWILPPAAARNGPSVSMSFPIDPGAGHAPNSAVYNDAQVGQPGGSWVARLEPGAVNVVKVRINPARKPKGD